MSIVGTLSDIDHDIRSELPFGVISKLNGPAKHSNHKRVRPF